MHWYVGFRDPDTPPGHEPTPFEWAGGSGALTRMARLFYEKHVPADPHLAPLFADMPPDQPQRLAAWLAEAFGAPDNGTDKGASGPAGNAAGPQAGQPLAEQPRARWVTLLGRSANEAGLPADPQFRSVFASCVEWLSRTAALAEPGAGSLPAPVPRWDWGPGGPPSDPPPASAGEKAAGTAAPPVLPGPDEPVSFAAHIRPLFRERDRQSMSFAFDLWSCDDVRAHAAEILQRVENGSMPCDGAWPDAWGTALRRWSESGMRP
jgi:truncated hemoglobin YjbI